MGRTPVPERRDTTCPRGMRAPARLMSFSNRLEAARRSCCISARWETTKVAFRPRLNNCTAVPITSIPRPREIRSSIRLKPRPEFVDMRPIVSPLPILRNEGVEDVLSRKTELGSRVLDRNGDRTQRSYGDGATTRGKNRGNRDLALEIGQRRTRVRRTRVRKDSRRAWLLQNLRAACSVVSGPDNSVDPRTIHGLEPGEVDAAHRTGILNLGPGHIRRLACG